jgi:hypothetical protein
VGAVVTNPNRTKDLERAESLVKELREVMITAGLNPVSSRLSSSISSVAERRLLDDHLEPLEVTIESELNKAYAALYRAQRAATELTQEAEKLGLGYATQAPDCRTCDNTGYIDADGMACLCSCPHGNPHREWLRKYGPAR